MTAPRYAASYCEENVWWLAHELPERARADVVFVTNERRSVALWAQRAARSAEQPVVWDYHVVLAVHGAEGTVVHDLDCTLGAPLPAVRWLGASFPFVVEARLQPRFRVVPAARFVARFTSDRAHMRDGDGGWLAPPPPWPPITGGDVGLARWLALDDGDVAQTRTLAALAADWSFVAAPAR